MENNVGLVSVLVPGVVALLAAVIALVPNIGRLRRLERVVGILEKTKDDAGKTRLLTIRDRIISDLEPKASGARNTLFVGVLVLAVGYGLTVGAGYSVWMSNGGEAPAPFWMWAWLVTSVLVALTGVATVIVGIVRRSRLK